METTQNLHTGVLAIIHQKISLSDSDQALILSHFREQHLVKGSLFLKAGITNRNLGFLVSGLMRSFHVDEKGNEHTTGFMQEGKFCTDLNSFRTGGLSERNIEVLVDADLLVLSVGSLQIFRKEVKDWMHLESEYLSQVLMDKIQFQQKIKSLDARKSYDLFLETYKQAALFAPQQQIASFLGISPFTLSRIRNT